MIQSPVARPSLGEVPLPADLYTADLAVHDRYQTFSAELLRLSLAGVAVVGFLLPILRPLKDGVVVAPNLLQDVCVRRSLIFSVLLFAAASGFALGHRYFASDAFACLLRALRLALREKATPAQSDEEAITKEKRHRDTRFLTSTWCLYCSGAALFGGAVWLVAAFVLVFGILGK